MVHLPGCSRGCTARCPSASSTPWSSSRPATSSTSWEAVYSDDREKKMQNVKISAFCAFADCAAASSFVLTCQGAKGRQQNLLKELIFGH